MLISGVLRNNCHVLQKSYNKRTREIFWYLVKTSSDFAGFIEKQKGGIAAAILILSLNL
jgi:hypothetical protein